MTNDHKEFDDIQSMVNYLENEYEITILSMSGHKNSGKSFIGEKI